MRRAPFAIIYTPHKHKGRSLLNWFCGNPSRIHTQYHHHEHQHRKDAFFEIICRLCEHGQVQQALDALSQTDHPPNYVYHSLLKACSKAKAFSYVKHVQSHLSKHHAQLSGLLGDLLTVAFANCGALDDARAVFFSLPFGTVYSWTAMICSHANYGHGLEALDLYHRMQQAGVQPNGHTFVGVFKACASILDLRETHILYRDAHRSGYDAEVFVGSSLVSTYGKCGSILDAEKVFIELSQRNVVTWNAMLSAYVDQDQCYKVLVLFRQMEEEGVSSNQQTYLITLQACGILAETKEAMASNEQHIKLIFFEIGQALHSCARKLGFTSHCFVWNTVLKMYMKCGHIMEAENMFDGVSKFDTDSWNAVLSVYMEQGQWVKALQLYQHMQEEGVNVNEQTIMITAQACGDLAQEMACGDGQPNHVVWHIGEALHADAHIKGFASDMFVGSTLIRMYTKLEKISQSEDLFNELPERDVVVWNTMLSAYVEQGQGEKALQLYRQMREEGICLDELSLVLAIQACGILAVRRELVNNPAQSTNDMCLMIGHALHADARQSRGLVFDAFIGSALLSMYAKCGSIVEAELIFDGLSQRDIVLWNAMLSAYVEQCHGEKALLLYRQMVEEGLSSNQQTVAFTVQACCCLSIEEDLLPKLKPLEIGQALHANACRSRLGTDVSVGIALMMMYGKYGCTVEVEHVFHDLRKEQVVVWGAMLSAYVEQHEGGRALQLYRQMQEEGVSPDQQTIVMALGACASLVGANDEHLKKSSALEIGQALHVDICGKNFTSDVFICSSLVSMYGKFGSIREAERVFDRSLDCNIVSWTAMLSAYIEQGEAEQALVLCKHMRREHLISCDIAVLCVLQACIETGSIELCRQLHSDVLLGASNPPYFVANTLIRAYGSCFSMTDGQAVFDGLSRPDGVSWNACIAGYAQEGNLVASVQMFEGMQAAGLKPDEVTFLSLLCACSHAGVINKGVEYFEFMSQRFGVMPALKHFVAMLSVLGRAGDFVKMENLLPGVPSMDDVDIWKCLLSACSTHGNIELGEQAFVYAVGLQSVEAATCVLMSNMYAEAGLQYVNEVASLRKNDYLCMSLFQDRLKSGYFKSPRVNLAPRIESDSRAHFISLLNSNYNHSAQQRMVREQI